MKIGIWLGGIAALLFQGNLFAQAPAGRPDSARTAHTRQPRTKQALAADTRACRAGSQQITPERGPGGTIPDCNA